MTEDKKGKLIGYARTSRTDQRLDLQINALIKYGVEDKNLFSEQLSALSMKRPQYDLALKRCRKGDTLVVWKLDRLGRNVHQLIETVNSLEQRGVEFKSLTEPFDTTSPMGTMMFNMTASMAQLERDSTAERTVAGIAAAKERNTYTTRSLSFKAKEWNKAVELIKETPILTNRQLADLSGLKYQTVYRNIKDIRGGIDFNTRYPYEENRKKGNK